MAAAVRKTNKPDRNAAAAKRKSNVPAARGSELRASGRNAVVRRVARGITLLKGGLISICFIVTSVHAMASPLPSRPATHVSARALAHAKPARKRAVPAPIVRDEALARVLGEALFRDTLNVMNNLPAVSSSSSPTDTTAQNQKEGASAAELARTLLAHQPIDRYMWLIQRAFDTSVWKGSDRLVVQHNFPAIWRMAVRRYMSTLTGTPARQRVCAPTESADDFDCRDEMEPATIIPIPVHTPAIIPPDQCITG